MSVLLCVGRGGEGGGGGLTQKLRKGETNYEPFDATFTSELLNQEMLILTDNKLDF